MKSLYLRPLPPLVFKWRSSHFGERGQRNGRIIKRDDAMSITSEPLNPVELGDRIRDAGIVTAQFLADITSVACHRFHSPSQSTESARIDRLIQSSAWTDAALALLDLELPQWQLRRIAYDAGEWHCALSRQRELPDWLDSAIEARHADLALSLLSALVEARRVSTAASRTSVPAVRRDANAPYEPVLCDNLG
jgi:hypothetical protein